MPSLCLLLEFGVAFTGRQKVDFKKMPSHLPSGIFYYGTFSMFIQEETKIIVK